MKIRHNIKIQEDGVTLKGQILETIFEEGEERGRATNRSKDECFLIDSLGGPALSNSSLCVWGASPAIDDATVAYTHYSKAEAQRALAYINEFTINDCNREQGRVYWTDKEYEIDWTPKYGDKVLCWDDEGERTTERVFLFNQGGEYPYVCVYPPWEIKGLINGSKCFGVMTYKKIAPYVSDLDKPEELSIEMRLNDLEEELSVLKSQLSAIREAC